MNIFESSIPEKVKVVYLKGYLAAMVELCQKLEAQVFKIQETIDRLNSKEERV